MPLQIVFFFGAGTWYDGLPFFVTEFCSRGSLRDILDDPKQDIDVDQASRFALHAARGMLFLHSRSPPRMHRDLKAANLLVSEDWTVKLADFGSARLLRHDKEENDWVVLEHRPIFVDKGGADPVVHFRVPCDPSTLNKMMSAEVGTALWLAPEIMEIWARGEMSCEYSLSADVYSYGITLYEIMSRQIPYDGVEGLCLASIFTLRRKICAGTRPHIPAETAFPHAFVRLMTACWASDPGRRPLFPEICDRLESTLTDLRGRPVSAVASPAFQDHFPLPSSLPREAARLSINRALGGLYE
mmetsp:Transcript_32437/g.97762  ORF Transcript_32437/g.97762 Transcript_32437/m.97762 type:complete len:300 (-) Transcript_32437:1295-2194(-)